MIRPSPRRGLRLTAALAFTVVSVALLPGQSTPFPGTSLVFPTSGGALHLRDLNGAIQHTWVVNLPGWKVAELAKPLPGGNILALLFDKTWTTQPHHKMVAELDWQGNVVWSFDGLPLNRFVHHDFQRLANGDTLVCAQEVVNDPTLSVEPLYDEVIMLIDPAGAVKWEWSTLTNRAQLPISAAGWTYLSTKPAGQVRTMFHLNSVQSLPPNQWEATDPRFAAGNVMVSYRDINLVMIIEPSSGNVVWTLKDLTVAQHHARMIPAPLKGAGNILIFDNGGFAGAPPRNRDSTRVIELRPTDNKLRWGYECVVPARSPEWCREQFSSAFMGSAQRLPNGHTLITASDQGRVFEVDLGRNTVWQFGGTGETQRLYRGYRLPVTWPSTATAFFPW